MSQHMKIAMMTSGGLAPCLSASIAQLVKYWSAALKDGKIASLSIRFYRDGYKGVLIGDSFVLDKALWEECNALNYLGGSPIGNSRVKVRKKVVIWAINRNHSDNVFVVL
jgi:diphosphate-dependent phosphofructokinase